MVVQSNNKTVYNIRLTKERSYAKVITYVFGGLVAGTFTFYLWKKYSQSQANQESNPTVVN